MRHEFHPFTRVDLMWFVTIRVIRVSVLWVNFVTICVIRVPFSNSCNSCL